MHRLAAVALTDPAVKQFVIGEEYHRTRTEPGEARADV